MKRFHSIASKRGWRKFVFWKLVFVFNTQVVKILCSFTRIGISCSKEMSWWKAVI
jgi:hypothetical protein